MVNNMPVSRSPVQESVRRHNWSVLWLALLVLSAPSVAVAQTECDEFLPKKECTVTVQMAATKDGFKWPRSHWDVMVKPMGTGTIVLEHSSPFLSCTVAAVPSPSSRDIGASFASFLTTMGTLGAAGNPVITAQQARGALSAAMVSSASTTRIDNQFKVLETDVDLAFSSLQDVAGAYSKVSGDLNKGWLYSFSDDATFSKTAAPLWNELHRLVNLSIPNLASQQVELNALNDALGQFHRTYDGDQSVATWLSQADRRLSVDTGIFNLLQEQLTALLAARTQLRQAHDFLSSISDDPTAAQATFTGPGHNYTTQKLPMSFFSQKQVTESVTCKDVLTQTSPFDTITFTAYYENLLPISFSAGAVVSLNGGHQVGAVSGPSTNPTETILAVTSNSKVQWMPAAFVELYHSYKCPWAQNGAPSHSFGYVCSFGPAFGILINPNNGATAAEYFEGVSFGIQRVALFIGNHTGRYQTFASGYTVGEVFPSGSAPSTPPTTRYWTNHLAFGITYRIQLR